MIKQRCLKLCAVLVAVFSCAAASRAVEEPAGEIALGQVIKLASEANPDVLSAQFEVQAADSRKIQAGVRPNPDLSFEAENVLGKNEMKNFDSAEYTVQLEQKLETCGKRSKRIRKAELARQLSSLDLTARQLDIEAETVRKFVVVQGAQEKLALNHEFMTLAGDFLKAVSARVQAGKVSPMEEEKAKILFSQQKSQLFQSERELDSARVQLSAMWGSVGPKFERVTGDFFTVPQLPSMPELATGLTNNPDVGRWSTEVEHRKVALKSEKAARIPDVSIAGGMRRFNDSGEDAFVLGLSIPFPVFDRNQGNVRESAALISVAEKQRLSVEVSANAALVEAYQEFLSASNKVSSLQVEIIPRAMSVYDSVRKGYLQGKFSYLEVLDAQRTLFEARDKYIDALVSCRSCAVDVGRISGTKKLIK